MFSPYDNLMNNNSDMDNSSLFASSFYENKVCPRCKTYESDVRETGVVGCSQCYTEFRDLLSRMAYQHHGRLEHLGKVPQKSLNKAQKQKEIEELRKLMLDCARVENFDQANIYKRKIDQLKGEM